MIGVGKNRKNTLNGGISPIKHIPDTAQAGNMIIVSFAMQNSWMGHGPCWLTKQ